MAKKLSRSKKTAHARKNPRPQSNYVTGIVFGMVAVVGVIAFFVHNQFIGASPGSKTLRAMPAKSHKPVCPPGNDKGSRCSSQIVTDGAGNPLASSTPSSSSYGPDELHYGYNLPCTPGGPVSAKCGAPASFGPVVAVVDAFHTPNVEADLDKFSAYYGLPSCTVANGCLRIVDQTGGTNLPTTTNQSWGLEVALDVQTVHSVCQTCTILLVEANTNSWGDLGTGINTAVRLGAVAVSNSWGANEFSSETSLDAGYLNHPGVAIVVSSGDSGNIVTYPSSSPYAIAVGGTTLRLFTDNTYATESVWSGAGSGCSLYETATADQQNLTNWNSTGCGTKRGTADISADADPNTGVAVYSSTYGGQTGWWQVGGTSLSAPIVAAAITLANAVPSGTNASLMLYKNNTGNNYHDVTTGSNGSCGTVMCNGAPGYDGGSGLGSPNGLGAFNGPAAPTATPTGTSTQNVTPTPVQTATPTPGGDTIKPVTAVTYPTSKTKIAPNSSLTIAVTATDNVGVQDVRIDVLKKNYITGNKLTFTNVHSCLDTTAPYTCTWTVLPERNAKYLLQAIAQDSSGNQGFAGVDIVVR